MSLPPALFRPASVLKQEMIFTIIIFVINAAIAVKDNPYFQSMNKPIPGSSWTPEQSNVAILPPPPGFKLETASSSEKYGWVPLVPDRRGRVLIEPNNINAFRELSITAVQPIVNNSLTEGDNKRSPNTANGKRSNPTYAYVIKNVADNVKPLPAVKFNVQIVDKERERIKVRQESVQNNKRARVSDPKGTSVAANPKNGTTKSEQHKMSAIELLIQTMTDIQTNLHKILEIASSQKTDIKNEIPARVIEHNARLHEPNATKRAISGVPQGSVLGAARRFVYVRPADLDSKREKQNGEPKHEKPSLENDPAYENIDASESIKTEHLSGLIDSVKKLSDGLDFVSPADNYAKSIRKVSQSRSLNAVEDNIPYGFPHGYNSLNHLPPDPLTALFLSHYGYYAPGLNGREAGFRNLYGYTASNNVHNNQPVGGYKVSEDQDKR